MADRRLRSRNASAARAAFPALAACALCIFASSIVLLAPAAAWAQDGGHDAEELARQLSNPVASLISVPFQANFDFGAGLDNEGTAITLNVQPVIPISISENWNLISRTILPIAHRDYLPLPDGDTFGLGDITQSLFFSPKHPGASGIIWGAGPVILIPTATDDVLGAGQLGLGPTAVVLKQSGRWSVGALVNHIWSVAGDDDRDDVNSTFLQPFVTRQLGRGRSVTLNTETTYDWEHEEWTVPINLSYSQVFKAGDRSMSFLVGARYYVDGPETAPQWGLRAALTLLFPE
jgi:hypothetical protein